MGIECEFHYYCDLPGCDATASNFEERLPEGWTEHSVNDDMEERHFCCKRHEVQYFKKAKV